MKMDSVNITYRMNKRCRNLFNERKVTEQALLYGMDKWLHKKNMAHIYSSNGV